LKESIVETVLCGLKLTNQVHEFSLEEMCSKERTDRTELKDGRDDPFFNEYKIDRD
jgi:hypothetical protein